MEREEQSFLKEQNNHFHTVLRPLFQSDDCDVEREDGDMEREEQSFSKERNNHFWKRRL